ncbi:cupin domain-containing protein [bacterium AH-315-I18]|nr:cupin domain-containing protein [Phycisphaeraceae bacterium]MBN4061043.1 cupin domain-containing protein [bacterium AH-315-I18]
MGLKPHAHRGAFEICFIVGGSVQWWVEHETYQLCRGAVYITQPDEPHGG